jgi:hypothetical protein
VLQEARLEGFANLEGACTTRRKLTYVKEREPGSVGKCLRRRVRNAQRA